jgi:hypothetical protein
VAEETRIEASFQAASDIHRDDNHVSLGPFPDQVREVR